MTTDQLTRDEFAHLGFSDETIRRLADRAARQFEIRFATGTDSYKLGHPDQYPPLTEFVQSNFTARATRIPGIAYAVLFGLQDFLIEWCGKAFQDFLAVPEDAAIEAIAHRVGPFTAEGATFVERMRALHRLGYLPLRFSAVPEGTKVPLRVPMFIVENTHPEFFWLPNFIESVMSAELWQPITSATTAHHLRQLLDSHAEATGVDRAAVDWQGHDFSFRGLEGLEAAKASGAGHLLSFTGSDMVPSVDYIEASYPSEFGTENGLIAASVPATEHAVMCAGGMVEEIETFRRLLRTYPTGILSVVSDTWDLWHVLTAILPELKDEIMAREGTLVIRPDSGDPVKIICGDPDAPADSPARLGVVRLLDATFGHTVNARGFKQLDSHVGAIYGDSINYERADLMCSTLAGLGYVSTSVVLGVGSFTYQYVTRDSLGMAMKATWAQVDGVGRELFKDPVTDRVNGVSIKKSAKGRLAVLPHPETGVLELVEGATAEQEAASLLQPVWEDGRFLRVQSFADVRAVVAA